MPKKTITTRVAGMVIHTEIDVPEEVKPEVKKVAAEVCEPKIKAAPKKPKAKDLTPDIDLS